MPDGQWVRRGAEQEGPRQGLDSKDMVTLSGLGEAGVAWPPAEVSPQASEDVVLWGPAGLEEAKGTALQPLPLHEEETQAPKEAMVYKLEASGVP